MSDLFKEKAQAWDAREMVNGLSKGIGATILEQVAFHSEMHIMDFGAGTGLISSQIAPLVQKILAVDTSEAMLEQLLNKPELKGKVEALCHNILEVPLDTRFDAIVSAMALHHVADTAHLFQQFAVHLKPGGLVALADLDLEDGSFHPPDSEGVFHPGFERDQIERLLTQNGFKNVRFTTAHTAQKNERSYPIFLVVANKG